MYTKNAEMKVGLLVLGASLALLGLLFYATGGTLLGDWRHVALRLEVGALAPREGDTIYVNGVDVGQVEKVELITETHQVAELTPEEREALALPAGAGGGYREVHVHAIARLRADLALPEGTEGSISQTVTGSRTLDLRLGRSGKDLTDEQTREAPILVRQASTIDAIGGKVEDLMKDAGGVVKVAEEALTEIRNLVVAIRTKVESAELDQTLGDVRATVASARRVAEELQGRIARIGENVELATGDLRDFAASASRLAARLEKEVPDLATELRAVVAKVDELVAKAAPSVEAFLADLTKTGKTLAQLSTEFQGLGPDARKVVREAGRDLDALMDVLTDTGRNLLDASEDLRAHPWKLLSEPPPGEIAFENLRSVMLNYVRAMQRMEAAAGTLREIFASGNLTDPAVRALVQRTLVDFEGSVEAYRRMEARLVELLEAEAPGAPAPAAPRGR